ncbi:MAG TPA: tripartite tricarboxylate transporter TctB family protein [Deltaproteobacteria bacterium]|nr:tripartite tricarboxylate transporter TctB family protein [Deltaproteobacteria bacterium]
MRRADIAGGLITILFGIFAISQAAQIDYWWKFGPGPGFLPLWASIVMVFGGCLLLIQALRKPKQDKHRPKDPQQIKRIGNVAAVAGLTVLTAVGMVYLGFSIAIFLFVALMIHMLGKYRWYITLSMALFISLAFYISFAKWLQVPLPEGIFGF